MDSNLKDLARLYNQLLDVYFRIYDLTQEESKKIQGGYGDHHYYEALIIERAKLSTQLKDIDTKRFEALRLALDKPGDPFAIELSKFLQKHSP